MSLSGEDKIINIYNEIFWFREEKIKIFERLCQYVRVHSKNNNMIHSQDDDWLMFYGHFCAHDRLNEPSDLQR